MGWSAGKVGLGTKAPHPFPRLRSPEDAGGGWSRVSAVRCVLALVCFAHDSLQEREEVKEVLIPFLIPSANYQNFLVVLLGHSLLSGWITLFVFVCCTWMMP